MTSTTSRALACAFAVLLPCFASACDGDDTEGIVTMDSAAALTCEPGTFRLAGSIDDQSVDVTQSSITGGFDQFDGGDFGSAINNIVDPEAPLTDLHVTWAKGVVVGGSTSATATVKIPTGPFPDDVFCAGAGSTVHSLPEAQGGGLAFRLASLASGPGCATLRRGSLRACWRP